MGRFKIFFYPALGSDVNGVVYIAVVVGYGATVGRCRETDWSSVAGTDAVGGVSTDIESLSGSKPAHMTDKRADAGAVCGVVVA